MHLAKVLKENIWPYAQQSRRICFGHTESVSVDAGKKISPADFMNETVFGILQRGLAHSGVSLLGVGTDQIRLWRLESDERTLDMDLRYIGYDGVEDEE